MDMTAINKNNRIQWTCYWYEMATVSVQSSQAVNIEDDTVTVTRTSIVVQRAANVEASQSSTVGRALQSVSESARNPAEVGITRRNSAPSGKYWNVVQSSGSRFKVLRNDR